MSANILFTSEQTLKDRTAVSRAIDGLQLKPVIKLAQDIFVQPALGSTLYKRLQTGIQDNNLNSYEVTLLNDYVTDCLIWATMAELILPNAYQIFAKGTLQKTADESNTPSRGDLNYLAENYSNKAEFYRQRMIDYLRANYTYFGEYASPGCGWNVLKPITLGYECPIYVGDMSDAVPCENTTTPGAYYVPPQDITIYPDQGVDTFDVDELQGKNVIIAVRSGIVQKIVANPTLTDEVNITGKTVSFINPVSPDEWFKFIYL